MRVPQRSQGDPDLPLLLWEIQQTARVAGRLLERAMASAGTTVADFGVLACISDEPGITQVRIARQLQVRPQTLTPTVDRLRRLGLVKGAPAGRGRRSNLRLTDAGRSTLDDAWPSIVDLNTPQALGLDERIARHLIAQLRLVRSRLSERETLFGQAAQVHHPTNPDHQEGPGA